MPYAVPEDDFKIGEHTYRARRMNALDQLHCSRRVSPLLAAFGKSLASDLSDSPLDTLGPITDFISKMPDEQVDYVIGKCMSHVSRMQPNGTGYAPMWSGGGLMYEDTNFVELLQICAKVLQINIGPFLPGLGSDFSVLPQ